MQRVPAMQTMEWQGCSLPGSPAGRRRTFLLAAVFAAAALAAPGAIFAQPSAAPRTVSTSKQHSTAHGRKSAKKSPAIGANAPQTPPAPPAPQWPVNDPPGHASILWNTQGLTIDAKNSSLQQILSEISTQTGAKIQGMGQDQRVFGVYGPGQPQEVLSELLEGSGYNVLMVGDAKRGVPQQVELSVRPKGGTEPNAPVSPGEMYEPPVAPPYQPPEPVVQPTQPTPPPRTPQQILQEMQLRQQQLREEQMRQQQQQQQQQQPPQ